MPCCRLSSGIAFPRFKNSTNLKRTPPFSFLIITWTHQIIHSIAASSGDTASLFSSEKPPLRAFIFTYHIFKLKHIRVDGSKFIYLDISPLTAKLFCMWKLFYRV